MINYIIAAYFGPRRAQLSKEKFFYINKQIEALNCLKVDKISKITFVVNPFDQEDFKIYEIVKNLNINFEVILKEKNLDFSYGCWQEAILANLDGFDYQFLIEDDYIPVIDEFYNYFLDKMDENTAFVCQLYDEAGMKKKHASISNGLISNKICKILANNDRNIFKLNGAVNYSNAEQTQLNFLDYFVYKKFEIKDISDISLNKFLTYDCRLVNRGKGNISIIEPIYDQSFCK